MKQNTYTTDYLREKQEIDKESYNKRILNSAFSNQKEKKNILDTGFGLGSLLIRLIKQNKLKKTKTYIGIDKNKKLLNQSIKNIKFNLREIEIKETRKNRQEYILKVNQKNKIKLILINKELLGYLKKTNKEFDMIIGNSFIDLINLKKGIKAIKQNLKPKGILYQSIVYDGYTGFYPINKKDKEVIKKYNESMKNNGDNAKKLLSILSKEKSFKEINAAPSDWVITPPYKEKEEAFIRKILKMIQREIKGRTDWIKQKINQINKKELIFISHQLDIKAKLRK